MVQLYITVGLVALVIITMLYAMRLRRRIDKRLNDIFIDRKIDTLVEKTGVPLDDADRTWWRDFYSKPAVSAYSVVQDEDWYSGEEEKERLALIRKARMLIEGNGHV